MHPKICFSSGDLLRFWPGSLSKTSTINAPTTRDRQSGEYLNRNGEILGETPQVRIRFESSGRPRLSRDRLLGNDRDRRGCDRGGARGLVRIVPSLDWRPWLRSGRPPPALG